MILEDATFEAFGYYPIGFKPQSNKPFLAACNDCGKIRKTSRNQYRTLCKSCSMKGNTNHLGCAHTDESKALMSVAMTGRELTDEHKANMSAAQIGRKHTEETKALISTSLTGIIFTDEHKANLSIALIGIKKVPFTEEHKANLSAAQIGEKNHNYNGGKKLANARHHAKRRQFGFIALNSYFEGCEGHHITHNFVIYVLNGIHQSNYHNIHTGQGMEAMNALALEFLVNGF